MYSVGPFAVAIVAIICWAIVELVNGPKQKKRTKNDQQQAETVETLQAQVANLKERVEVLERIVTDEKYSLNKEFENLKKGDAA